MADGGFYAFIGVDADDVDGADAEVLEDVVDIGGGEDAAGGFIDDDFISDGGDFFEKTGFCGAG